MAVFSRLLPPIGAAYALQALFAGVFVPLQTEIFYDACGAVGFLSSTFLSLYYPALKLKYWNGVSGPLPALTSFAPRQLLLSAALGIWSLRLGSFLFYRTLKAGGDSRFDKTKRQPLRFTYFWMAQATWISLVGLPVYMANALPAPLHPPLGPRDYIGLGIYASSFLLEIIADRQKTLWKQAKAKKQHEEKFITSGLWSMSRHPNYVGEVGLWTGIYIASSTVLQSSYFPRGTLALGAASPAFLYFLISKVSGVPPLERAADTKFGADPKWAEYKRTVPVFWPWGRN